MSEIAFGTKTSLSTRCRNAPSTCIQAGLADWGSSVHGMIASKFLLQLLKFLDTFLSTILPKSDKCNISVSLFRP